MSNLTLRHMQTILSSSSSQLMTFNPLNAELNPICHLLALLGGATIVVVSRLRVNSSSIPIVSRRFFTWIALGEADLRFSLILVTKANAVEGGTTSAT